MLAIGGCSGEITEDVNSVEMQEGVTYEVKRGDKLIDAGDAEIEVTHELDSNLKKVTLISGRATLVYESYELK